MEWQADSRAVAGGCRDHGVATPIANHRGTVATVDAQGRNVVLVWLYDHRGGYALLLIDAESGAAEQFPVPFDQQGDGPFAALMNLTARNCRRPVCTITSTTKNIPTRKSITLELIAATASSRLISPSPRKSMAPMSIAIQTSTLCLPTLRRTMSA